MASTDIGALESEDAVMAKLKEVRKDRLTASKRGNAWTAVAQLHRLEADLIKRLAEIRAPRQEAPTRVPLSPDEELEEILSAVDVLDDEAIDAIEARIAHRRGPRLRLA